VRLDTNMSPEYANDAIAAALEELGDLYELDGAIVHRVLAYRTAARAVRESPVSVAALAASGRATEIAGIGKTLQEKILALVQTGSIPAAVKLRAKFPPGLIEITRLPGLGPKRVRLLHSELGIDSAESLREAALAQRLRSVRGLGEKFEVSVLAALEAGLAEQAPTRVLLSRAVEIADALIEGLLARAPAGSRIQMAGSARRSVDAVKDIDLIATGPDPLGIAESLAGLDLIERVSSTATAGAKARTHSGLAVDLRVGTPEQSGNLLQHFTGSGTHNTALREASVRAGLHVSEYGILDDATGQRSVCASEHEVYELLGFAYIPPELRENRGELQAARLNDGEGLPVLIEESDIRGDLHCHTVASDGHHTIEEMALAARERGYEYLAITDHSASHGFGNDVSAAALTQQIERVAEVDSRVEGLRLLAGSEVNILPDGTLDYEDDLLARLDWVIASVHTAFGSSEQAMTERVIAAIEHPLVDAIGHPTGRLIERRAPYPLDLQAVFEAAARTGTMLEINANPARRDLSDVHAKAAVGAGVRILINSDAHRVDTLAVMRWGVASARRGWLTASDVANTEPWERFAKLRKREAHRR
jgi:DNA polymerase (family X)